MYAALDINIPNCANAILTREEVVEALFLTSGISSREAYIYR